MNQTSLSNGFGFEKQKSQKQQCTFWTHPQKKHNHNCNEITQSQLK